MPQKRTNALVAQLPAASEIIVQVKDGMVSNVACILFLLALCGLLIFCTLTQSNPVLTVLSPPICFAWLYVSYVCFRNIRNPKMSALAISNNRLVWVVRSVEAGDIREEGICLKSIEKLEFVLPATKYQGNARLYSLGEMFIVDTYGHRLQLPAELLPGVNRKKITEAITKIKPTVRVVERMEEKKA